MKYHFKVYESENGFWAECLELQGCITQGNSDEQLYENCVEALNLFLEEPNGSKIIFPLPNQDLENQNGILNVPVDPEIAFAVTLKHYRNSHHLTQQEVAKRLGMKNIYSYQRLERRSNPTLNVIKKVKNVFPEIEIESLL